MSRDRENPKKLTRRTLIREGGKIGAGLALAPLVLDLSACSSDSSAPKAGATSKPKQSASSATAKTAPAAGGAGKSGTSTSTANAAPIAEGSVLLGLYKGDGMNALKQAASKLDFSWLGAGDTVLIKVASNSGVPHPATTSPNGVRAMAQELKARGAGKVIVADQAGVEWVRKTPVGRFSSTRDQWSMSANGLIAVEQDAEVHFFDDGDWDNDYIDATPPDGSHWPRGLRIAGIVNQVDHIIYMPRIGAHSLAGLTLGQKMSIGWLRDDSRHDMHHDAQFFYEKYTEVNYTKEIRDRFRMVVTVAEKALLHGGPDMGTVYALDPAIVVASTTLPNHDSIACSLLVTLQKQVPATGGGMTYTAASASFVNGLFSNGAGVVGTAANQAGPWQSAAPASSYTVHPFEQGITKDRAIARGWELTGGKPSAIDVTLDGETLDPMLKSGLETHGEGLYKFG